MNVERAEDGKNAVEIFRNHPEGTFDVILMDIMMPEMNGYEAAKAIRAMNDRPDGKNIPDRKSNVWGQGVITNTKAAQSSTKPLFPESIFNLHINRFCRSKKIKLTMFLLILQFLHSAHYPLQEELSHL